MARQIELNMMGQPTRSLSVFGVSKEIRLVKENRDGELKRLKQRLLKGLNDGGEKYKQAWA